MRYIGAIDVSDVCVLAMGTLIGLVVIWFCFCQWLLNRETAHAEKQLKAVRDNLPAGHSRYSSYADSRPPSPRNAIVLALVGMCLAFACFGGCGAVYAGPVKAPTLPELRAMGPVNPIKNPHASSYRKWTKVYCEIGLLRGVHCTNSIEGHHFGVTHAQILALGPAFYWAYTNQDNLVSLCDAPNCPLCGGSCHLLLGHGGKYANVNGNFVFLYRTELVKWIARQVQP